MKRYLLIMMFCLVSLPTFAESITWMSKADADKLTNLLKTEKYLLNYCDCCGQGQANLVRIQTAAVEKSNKDAAMYSVKVTGKKVLLFEADANGNFSKPSVLNEVFSEAISLNQSMLPKEGRGLPVGYFLGMDAQHLQLCMDFVYYPFTGTGSVFESILFTEAYQQYEAWYNENIAKHFLAKSFIGSWGVVNICLTASDCKGFPPSINSLRLAFDANGNVDLAIDNKDNRGKWTYQHGKITIEEKTEGTKVFGFRMEKDLLILSNMIEVKNGNGAQDFRLTKLEKIK